MTSQAHAPPTPAECAPAPDGWVFHSHLDVASGGDLQCGFMGDPGVLTTHQVARLCQDTPGCEAFSVSRPEEGERLRYCLKNATGPLVDRADTTMGHACEGVYLSRAGGRAARGGVRKGLHACPLLS